MFIRRRTEGRLVSIPALDTRAWSRKDFRRELWREGAKTATGAYVSPVHPRQPDKRMAPTSSAQFGPRRERGGLSRRLGLGGTDWETPVHDRICRSIELPGIWIRTARRCSKDFKPNTGAVSPEGESLIQEIRHEQTGHLERNGNLYSFSPMESTGWIAVVEQPRAVAYKPVRDLFGKITVLALVDCLDRRRRMARPGNFTVVRRKRPPAGTRSDF